MTLAQINRLDLPFWLGQLAVVFEHSPWVAERAWEKRPFDSIQKLHETMMQTVRQAGVGEQLALIRAHPELAGAESKEGTLTADSSGEQGRLGFARLSKLELQKMVELNRKYREKFGFPCIVALRLHATRDSVMEEMQRRLGNNAETELETALEQIGRITRGRLDRLIS